MPVNWVWNPQLALLKNTKHPKKWIILYLLPCWSIIGDWVFIQDKVYLFNATCRQIELCNSSLLTILDKFTDKRGCWGFLFSSLSLWCAAQKSCPRGQGCFTVFLKGKQNQFLHNLQCNLNLYCLLLDEALLLRGTLVMWGGKLLLFRRSSVSYIVGTLSEESDPSKFGSLFWKLLLVSN